MMVTPPPLPLFCCAIRWSWNVGGIIHLTRVIEDFLATHVVGRPSFRIGGARLFNVCICYILAMNELVRCSENNSCMCSALSTILVLVSPPLSATTLNTTM
jgi:hypothetical protein